MNDSQNQDGVVFNANSTPQDNNTEHKDTTPQEPVQAAPIFETVPTDIIDPIEPKKESTSQGPMTSPEVPEEIPDEIGPAPQSSPPNMSASEPPPPIYEENRSKFLFIGITALVFLVIFFLLIKVLLGKSTKKTDKITLTYWGLWEEKGVIDPLIQDYQRTNPNITITYTKMDPQDYRAKILARSREGKGPDIFRFHNTWLPMLKEVAAPLPKNVISDDEFKKTFYPVQETDLKLGKYYYGIPLEIDGLVLAYNDDLLKRGGIEGAPKTWEEVVDVASKLTVKDTDGKIVTSGLAIGTANNVDHFSEIFGWMFLQNGGDLKTLSSTEGKGTLELYTKFAEAPDNIWDAGMPNSTQAFIQRKVAMIIVPSWEIANIKLTDPDLKVKATVLPILPGGELLSLSNYWVEGVSQKSKNQLEAWKFLKYLSSKETLTKSYAEQTKVRPFGEPYSRQDLGASLQSDPYLSNVIQEAPHMKSLPLVARTYDGGLNDETVKYIEDAINNVFKGVSYDEALQTAQKGIEQIFTKYKIE